MARKLSRILAACTILALPVGSALANSAAPEHGWGKSGVSYADYRADALECGQQGLASDIDHTAPVETLRKASRELGQLASEMGSTTYSQAGPSAGLMNNIGEQQAAQQAAQPEKRYAEMKHLMLNAAAACMVQQGYTHFKLTPEQQHAYAALKSIDDRRHYFHSLASDPKVLAEQSDQVAPAPAK